MSALPSFVELMSSLGLSSSGEDTRRASLTNTPSPSCSPPSLKVPLRKPSFDASPAIVVSQYESTTSKAATVEPRRRASSGSIRASRYAPYASSSRRGSMSTLSDDEVQRRYNQSSSTASSRRSSSASLKLTYSPPKSNRMTRRPSQLNIVAPAPAPGPAPCAPISSFARRHSPQTSPTSPTFASRRCRSTSSDVMIPVSIPTLPPLIAESFAGFSMSNPVSSGTHSASRRHTRNMRRSISPSPMEICEGESDAAILRRDQSSLRISSLCRPSNGRLPQPGRRVTPIA